ncbi:protein kinase [Paenibacillaceae bacterium WGS1546]|uniref:serine/threonine-protein kinase n=1 Tax=Cohnella sp. WGS1546 TaxID=3366810 RepID=UPI00372D0FAE
MSGRRQGGMELAEGQLYGERYRIVMPIGKGGMGRVYLAEDTRLGGKKRALKLTRPLPEERRAFLPEAQLLSELDHPHLPAIVDYYPPDDDGVACIVMEYVAGDTLAERFERCGLRLPFPFVLDALIDLCEVLTYLHARRPSVVFRDLKPANVLLDAHDRAILVDFGIARRYRENRLSDTLQLGTPGFAAPEQLRGEQSDGRTDLYGLGALAYFLLSGGGFAMRHRGPLNDALQEDATADFLRLLERLLADDPRNRPQSAEELLEELRAIKLDVSGEDGRSRRSSAGGRAYGNVWVVAIASAYPGAGATFAALALSGALSRAGVSHALVECPGGDAELHGLLNGARRMPRGAAFASPNGRGPAAPAWREGAAAYYPLDPDPSAAAHRAPDRDFAKWLRRLGVPLVLLDVSSRWDRTEMSAWLLRSADEIAMVADCYPAKWSLRRQAACLELNREANRRTIRSFWLANRDHAFADRTAWLSLLPERARALLPMLSASSVREALWRGEGLPRDAKTSRLFDEALRSWTFELRSGLEAERIRTTDFPPL